MALGGEGEIDYWRYSPTSAERKKFVMSRSWRNLAG
jgi:hypothetical protein